MGKCRFALRQIRYDMNRGYVIYALYRNILRWLVMVIFIFIVINILANNKSWGACAKCKAVSLSSNKNSKINSGNKLSDDAIVNLRFHGYETVRFI